MSSTIHTLDLDFQGTPGVIASYLILHEDGAVLVESGPGSTTGALEAGLAEHGLTPGDVTDVLLTHIHLDHAGAAGWLAERGVTVHAHHVGTPHLLSPEKLLASAARIYGDDMDRLWGDFLPVPDDRLVALHDGDRIEIGDLRFDVVETPGHAYHHVAYRFGDTCFTGDVAGVRLRGSDHVALPLPPPEINLDLWRASLQRLRALGIKRLVPTHFGFYTDVARHLEAVTHAVADAQAWAAETIPQAPSDEALRKLVTAWLRERALREGVTEETWRRYETANPSWMAAAGLRRYWKKHAAPDHQQA